ncbi:unnamed protein product, partial [marine sediment metagenome]
RFYNDGAGAIRLSSGGAYNVEIARNNIVQFILGAGFNLSETLLPQAATDDFGGAADLWRSVYWSAQGGTHDGTRFRASFNAEYEMQITNAAGADLFTARAT